MPENNLRATLEASRREIVERMPENNQYAKVSAHLSAAIRTLAEIDGNLTKPDIERGV
jgi:hypothetical protein